MVQLPKPSVLAGSAGIQVLPTAQLASQLPDTSDSHRCYSFGFDSLLTNEVNLDVDLRQILDQLLAVSRLLCIPTLFGRGDGQAWTQSEQHYPALLQWKQQHVPALLSQIAQLLGQLNSTDNACYTSPASAQLFDLALGHVICTVARYLPPRPVGLSLDSDSFSHELDSPLEDGWTDDTTSNKARIILDSLHESHSAGSRPSSSSFANALLTDYIKPIFREVAASSSGSTSSIDPTTGRKKAPAPGSAFISYLDANLGQHRFESAAEDNDASNLAPAKFALSVPADTLRSTVLEGVSGSSEGSVQSLMDRNESLGCVNVLAWCLENLKLKTESDWVNAWPLLVPPLLTLLEHPQPKFRLKGSLLVHKLLLRTDIDVAEEAGPRDVRTRQVTLGKILIRTGIGSLLERALHANLTYIHDSQYAPGLLLHSIGALRQLILITTHPIAYRSPSQSPFDPPVATAMGDSDRLGANLDEANDCGKRRMEALFRLVSEAILSTWSYLPLPPSSTRLGRELVHVTCTAYMTLADDLAAPAMTDNASVIEDQAREYSKALGGAARFLDVTLDWIFRSWMSNVAFDHTDQIATTIRVITLASRLLSTSSIPSLPRYSSFILSSVAKCWINALDSPLRTSTTRTEASAEARWKELEQCLTQFLTNLSQMDSSIEPRWSDLVKIDSRLAVLSSSH